MQPIPESRTQDHEKHISYQAEKELKAVNTEKKPTQKEEYQENQVKNILSKRRVIKSVNHLFLFNEPLQK